MTHFGTTRMICKAPSFCFPLLALVLMLPLAPVRGWAQNAPAPSDQPPVLAPGRPAAAASAAPVPTAPAPANAYTVSHYDLTLAFNFGQHQFSVNALVTLNANRPLAAVMFKLGNAFRIESVRDEAGHRLSAQRQAAGVLVSLADPLESGGKQTLRFVYSGVLANADFSPISGIRTDYVGPEGAFLLYPGEWFPMVNYGTDRFTATVRATLPPPYGLVASGHPTATVKGNEVVYEYTQASASFPGSVVVTGLRPVTKRDAGLTANFYFSSAIAPQTTDAYAQAAGRIFAFLSGRFGPPPTNTLHFIELPNDALPSFSSPDMIFLSRDSITPQVNYRLLTDEIAQQWLGNQVSPATLNDAWLQYGGARFAEALYTQAVAGGAAYRNLIDDLTVGALTYPEETLSNAASLYVFSPQFQDLTYDKGAMLFHMLRWVLGDEKFFAGLKQFIATYSGKSAGTGDFEHSLEQSSGVDLRAFFSEWYRGNGVPEFQNQYTVYRLDKGGYRVMGRIVQPMEVFDMPVELQITTEGATEMRRVPVRGTSSDYSVDVAARPLRIIIDPNNWLLKSTPDLKLRVAIARGDNDVAAGDFASALKEYQNAIKINPISSLAHYRIAETHYQQQNWQNAADEYRQAINGDQVPKWTTVWSHIQLGKIFDQTGQRDRAINEYQQALATHDDTENALAIARQYLQTPFKPAASH